MTDTHTEFLRRLDRSHTGVYCLSRHIQKKGFWVNLPPYRVSPSQDKSDDYTDNGDMFVDGCRLEVKTLGVKFGLSANDWPYGDKFIICSVSSFEKAQLCEQKPAFYFILSACYKCMAQVSVASKKHWYTEMVHDSRYEFPYEAYHAPLKIVRWKKIEI